VLNINKAGVSLLVKMIPEFNYKLMEPVALFKGVYKNTHSEEQPIQQLTALGPNTLRQAKFCGFFIVHALHPWLR
jgi:hypothetical protein